MLTKAQPPLSIPDDGAGVSMTITFLPGGSGQSGVRVVVSLESGETWDGNLDDVPWTISSGTTPKMRQALRDCRNHARTVLGYT